MSEELDLTEEAARKLHYLLFESEPDPKRIEIIKEAINIFPPNQDKYIFEIDL